MRKRGQQTMGMPFGMIFSIFLIIVFFVAAFIGVKYFFGVSDVTKIGLFYEDLQDAVTEAWQGSSSNFVACV